MQRCLAQSTVAVIPHYFSDKLSLLYLFLALGSVEFATAQEVIPAYIGLAKEPLLKISADGSSAGLTGFGDFPMGKGHGSLRMIFDFLWNRRLFLSDFRECK